LAILIIRASQTVQEASEVADRNTGAQKDLQKLTVKTWWQRAEGLAQKQEVKVLTGPQNQKVSKILL
jgi:hypothetical protein